MSGFEIFWWVFLALLSTASISFTAYAWLHYRQLKVKSEILSGMGNFGVEKT